MVSRCRTEKMDKKVIYSSPFIPAEWIEAHGLSPSRRTFMHDGPRYPVNIEAGVCPYMRGFINNACGSGDVMAVILTTTCDQMRRGADFIRMFTKVPCFLMNIPSSCGTSGADRLYARELKRLGGFLVSLGGVSPGSAKLASVMLRYEGVRRRLLGARGEFSGREFSEKCAIFGEKGDVGTPDSENRTFERKIPIGFIGGPLAASHLNIFDLFSRYGATVVMDATETGERSFPAPFDMRRLKDEPVQVLAESYYGAIPDIFERPNKRLFMWMNKAIESRSIRGVALVRHVWCDKWHGEVHRFRETIKVPLLDIELDGECAGERTRNRIQAFMETI